ncbi:peptidase G2 autoproteolytic cleavage domain-containing protein [Microvirga mediterraneensis]|uniref:Peptidase G2 IMC autoproteolytic cleavage domain-containing protein n=1 Tax=Microvirga mediterraneensis TaxID=2754695 RepID=A0A838BVP7_9HYPH|nr:peptidase G2 autoproteolytic cleavage domain-containing protein [Microvirga mediterraneensis]MBA1159340.1 hypothetical protein [Microvirga mediterraneensis]
MTVAVGNGRSETWNADGANRNWDFPFKALSASHLVLEIEDAAGSLSTVTSGFTVAGLNSDDGGTVTYPISPAAPLPIGTKITVVRQVPLAQPNRIGNQGGFHAETHERTFDLLAMQVQQIYQEGTARDLRAPVGDGAIDMRLPAKALRAGKLLGFDDAGKPRVTADFPSTIIGGSGIPSAGVGVNGDYYLDEATLTFYGPKTSGAWGAGRAIGVGSDLSFKTRTAPAGFGSYQAGFFYNPDNVSSWTDVKTYSVEGFTVDIGGFGPRSWGGSAITGVEGAIKVPANSTLANHAAGVAGHVTTSSPVTGSLGLWGIGNVAADGCIAFGGNTVAEDKGFNNTNLWGLEVDINMHNSNTIARGIDVTGGGPVDGGQISIGYRLGPMGAFYNPPKRWKFGWQSTDGAAAVGMELGTLVMSAESPSQAIQFRRRTGGVASNGARLLVGAAGDMQVDAQNSNGNGLSLDTQKTTFANDLLYMNVARAGSTSFNFLRAFSGNLADVEIMIRGDGSVLSDGAYSGAGADYAEYFEWADGNPAGEDRRGLTVVIENGKVRGATPEDDAAAIVGAVSTNPMVVGDTGWNRWTEKYLRDAWGSYVLEPYEVVSWEDRSEITIPGRTVVRDGEELHYPDETRVDITPHSYPVDEIPEGVTVPDDAVRSTQERRVLNPDYDPEAEYTPRSERPEWVTIGLLGKLRIRKGQPVGDRWLKLRDISGTVEEWLVR